jgi:hypothetical protein
MTSTNDNGVHIQRLDPAHIDVVLGSARTVRSSDPERQGRSTVWLWVLVAVAVAGWALAGGNDRDKAPQATLPPPAPAPEPVTVVNTAVATRVVNQATVVIINAPTKAVPRQVEAAEPAPASAPPQGMVSAQYLAQFKAGGNRPGASAERPFQVATVTIREWDGPNRYVAKWRIEDNVIDQGSVCFNFPGDSIQHRECRRAAQQYFREQCKDWTRRAEKARDKETREARVQYCEVAQGFAP